jgi:hypothetical protein
MVWIRCSQQQHSFKIWLPIQVLNIVVRAGFRKKPSMSGLLQLRPSYLSYNVRERLCEQPKREAIIQPWSSAEGTNKLKGGLWETIRPDGENVTFREGDLVLLLQRNIRRCRSKKLSSPWIGPYTVVEITGVNRVLRSGTKIRTFKLHSNRLKFFI